MNAMKKTDRHKPAKMVRVNSRLAEVLELVAERNATTFPTEVNRAIRELLEREHLWPPQEDSPKGKRP